MKRALSLLLLAPTLGCSDDTIAAAREAVHHAAADARAAAAEAVHAVGEIDLSAGAEVLQERAGWVLTWCTDQLEGVRDAEAAQRVAAAVVEVLDAAGGLFERVAEEVPNRAELRQRVDGLRAQHEGDSAVLEALEPALARLSALLE